MAGFGGVCGIVLRLVLAYTKGMERAVLKRIGLYLLVFAVLLPLASLSAAILYELSRRGTPPAAGLLDVKTPYYLQNAERFNVLFLGDSRTLTNIHPELLAPYLEPLQSFNLGHWAHWFPTQYALFADIVPHIPADTVVVWSIGHQNFDKLAIQPVYPVGWERIIPMSNWGYDPAALLANQLFFTPVTMLYVQRDKAFRKIESVLARPVLRLNDSIDDVDTNPQNTPAPINEQVKAQELITAAQADPAIARVVPWYNESGQIASVEYYTTYGGSLRMEISPDYYRSKQAESVPYDAPGVFTADKASWRAYEAILDLCRAHGIKLIINIFEEAPYRYAGEDDIAVFRAFMNGPVTEAAAARDYPVIQVDLDQFRDHEYFDYNHMNSAGVARLSPLLGPLVRQTITEHYPDAL